MLKRILKYPAIIILFLLLSICARATNTYDWVGSTSTDWKTPQNWKLNGSAQSSGGTFPGQSASTDIVDFGVNTNYTANQPILSGTLVNSIASITFGGNGGTAMTLTITGSTLTVTGAITQNHGSGANAGTSISTTIQGTGSISCASMGIGDSSTPGSQSNATQTFTTVLTSSIANLTVYGTLNINSQCLTHNGSHHDFYNPSFDLTGGALTVVNITVTASNYFSGNAEAFNMGISATANTLNIAGSITVTSGINGTVSFLNAAANTSASTVNYNGTSAQTVYTGADSFIASSPTTYGNLTFTNSGTKTLDGSTLTIGGNLINNSGSILNGNGTSGSATISGATSNAGTININAETVTFTGLMINTGTYISGTGTSTFSSSFSNNGGTFATGSGSTTFNGNYTNTGTFTANSTGSVIFSSSGAQSLVDNSSAGTTLINTQFQGGGTKTMSGSKGFYISSAGTLTMSGNTTLAAGGVLTLNSDASGSAGIAMIPSGCSITGTVGVQRYISGKRGWRFLSSPVYAGTDVYGNKICSINYLKNSIYVSGPTGTSGGFDLGGNFSIALYREDVTPDYSTFSNTNYRGLSNILTDPLYSVVLQSGTYNIPVANGYQVFIRGDRTTGSITDETTNSASYSFTSVTLTASGTINQGQVKFANWYTPNSLYLSEGNTYPTLTGYNLAGNPYPSSINWDTYNTSNPNTGIYVNNVGLSIYSYNTINKKYAVYQAGNEGKGGTNGATNIVGSGQGFFVVANGANPTLTFNESAKTSSSYTGVGAIMSSQPIIAPVIQFIRLRMMLDSVNTDETVLRFNSNAKNTFDINEDAPYMPGGGKLSINSLSADSVSLAINQLPLKNGLHTGLKIDASASGTYSLDLEELNGIPQMYDIWLKDAFTRDSVNLRKTHTYSFAVDKSNAATFGNKRFSVIVKQDSAYAYKLLGFNAARVGYSSHVETHWTTANEENYTNFTVERSTDGGNTFTVVGGLWGTGAGAYSLVDKDAVTGTNLYRLKSEDINNVITYSNIAIVVINDKGNNDKLHLYPNPTSGIVNLDVLDKTNGNISYNITVSNSTGFIVKQVTSSQPNWKADVSTLLPGTYLIRVINSKTQDFIGESKLIKL